MSNFKTIVRITQFCAIMLAALVMGVFWGTWFALGRGSNTLPPDVYVAIGHHIINNLSAPMRVLMPLAILANILLVVLLAKWRNKLGFWLAVLGLIFMVGALVVTLGVEVPLDNKLKAVTATSLPSNWMALRDRWETHHLIRTMLSIASLGCLVASSLHVPVVLGTTDSRRHGHTDFEPDVDAPQR